MPLHWAHPYTQVYTYMLQPLICQRQLGNEAAPQQQQEDQGNEQQPQEDHRHQQEQQQQQQAQLDSEAGHLSGWELRLLMEYCDEVCDVLGGILV